MAGLFLSSIEDFTSTVDTVSQYTSTTLPGQWFDQNDVNRAFSVLRAELSDDGKLPSWTTHDLSFVPVLSNVSASVSANLGNTVFASTTSAIGSSLDCVDLPNQATLNSSGPGIYMDNQGTQSVRFKPEAANVGPNQTCTAAYDFTNTVQSIFFQTMELLDLTTGSTSNIDLEGCGSLILLVSGESSTQTISLSVCSSSIYASDLEVQYNTDQAIISQQAVGTASHGTAVLRNETELLLVLLAKVHGGCITFTSSGPNNRVRLAGAVNDKSSQQLDNTIHSGASRKCLQSPLRYMVLSLP